MKQFPLRWLFLLCMVACKSSSTHKPAIVFQTDFGLKDGAVSSMKGVALTVDPALTLMDLTHEIPAYNIWEAAYRLEQTAPYWPTGTVFVSVVDPGVGSDRRSVVLKTRSGHFFVGPDNGSFTLVAETLGIEAVHQIDEAVNRRAASGASYTFHGRDVYAYTAARLASGKIGLAEVGPRLGDSIVRIPYQKAELRKDTIYGMIPILDVQYGNVWTNIPDSLVYSLGIRIKDTISLQLYENGQLKLSTRIPLVNTFSEVANGQPLGYFNSLMQFSVALNESNYADFHRISSGPGWTVQISK
jgi:S-adenosylmethionine hydrolase